MDGEGKRVSWVELYLDLVFVLAVAQLAHLIVAEPEMRSGVPGVVRALLLIATFQLARLRPELSPYGYVWLLTRWVVMCAALSTRALHGDAEGDLERYLGATPAQGSAAPPSRSHRGP